MRSTRKKLFWVEAKGFTNLIETRHQKLGTLLGSNTLQGAHTSGVCRTQALFAPSPSRKIQRGKSLFNLPNPDPLSPRNPFPLSPNPPQPNPAPDPSPYPLTPTPPLPKVMLDRSIRDNNRTRSAHTMSSIITMLHINDDNERR